MKTTSLLRRYSLRFLLTVVAVVAIALAYAKNTLSRMVEDHERLKTVAQVASPSVVPLLRTGDHSSIAGLAKSGGLAMVTFEPAPRWLNWFAMLIGHEPASQITELQFISSGFDDDQLMAVAEISTLKAIELQLTQVTDAGLVEFCRNSKVKNIRVGNRNEHITETGRDLAARITSKYGYSPKWPPPG